MIRFAVAMSLGLTTVAAGEEGPLQVDPLLFKQLETVWSIIAQPDNPLWPGWNANNTPVMIYLPGAQEVLVNHPDPPVDFQRYRGPRSLPGLPVAYRDGPTLIKWDGQNTSRKIYGVQTLVLADTLSNRKLWLRGWLADARSAEQKLSELPYDSLRADPYEQLAMIAHEAFHVFQMQNFPDKAADERQVRIYPCLSVQNNVGFALEAAALHDCLRARDPTARDTAASRWLAIRRDRRADLPAQAVEYEDRNELIEGTAKYIELALMKELENSEPDPALWWAQGFRGFDDLGWFRARRLTSMIGNMRGEVNVNNDPYGTSPVRGRLYFSGMGIALLLDEIVPDWKQRIAAPGATLTSLAASALQASDDDLQAALREAKSGAAYAELVRGKQRLAADGKRDTATLLKSITNGPKTLLTIDYAALHTTRVGLSFTPFGVRSIDAKRTIYTLVPITAETGSAAYGFTQNSPTPTLEDRTTHRFQFQLTDTVTADELAHKLDREGAGPWHTDNLTLDLPGVNVRAARARVTHCGQSVVVQFLPADP